MVTIDLKKRDLWILTALIFFLIGVGLVIGFGDYKTGNPKVMGHSSDEVMVLNSSGTEITLQNYINNNYTKTSLEYAQAFRQDGGAGGGPIITISGSSSAFVVLDNKRPHDSSQFTFTTLDGIGCDGTLGWKVVGCWMAIGGTSNEDIYPYNNGCITKKYDTADAEMSIVCMKIS